VPDAESIDFAQYAGTVVFPRSPQELSSTLQCPACFVALSSSVCGNCGLDLNHPAAAELAVLSAEAADAMNRRLTLIGRIRYETAQLRARQAAPLATPVQSASPGATPAVSAETLASMPAPVAPTTVPATATVGSVAPQSPSAPTAAASASPGAPRRSSVQVILLITGIALLSIAAIFFLVFAFISYGIVVRSIIIGSITVAAIVAASLLRRRGLRATAEGIAVFAVVLIYLDAFAVRANDLFGASTADGLSYWGLTLAITAIAFVPWSRLSGLRTPQIAAFATIVPGVALLAAGLSSDLDPWTRAFAAAAAAGLAGLVHPLAVRTTGQAPDTRAAAVPERIVVLSLAALGLLLSLGFAFAVQPDRPWAAAIALAIVTVVASAQVLVALRIADGPPAAVALLRVIAAIGAVAAASAVASGVLRIGDPDHSLLWPALTAGFVALALEFWARRASGSVARSLVVGSISAGSVAALALLAPLGFSVFSTIRTATGSPWRLPAAGIVTYPEATHSFAILALAGTVLLVVGFWALGGILRRRSAAIVWSSSAVVVLAVPLLSLAWAIVAGWLLVAVLGVAALLYSARLRSPARKTPLRRAPLVTGAIVAATLAYSASWVSSATWWWASLAIIALLLTARLIFTGGSAGPRAALLGVATGVALVGAAALAYQLAEDVSSWNAKVDGARFLSVLAVVLVAVAAALPAAVASRTDRRTLFWIALPVAALSAGSAWIAIELTGGWTLVRLLLPEPATSLVLALLLTAGLLLWVLLRSTAALAAERITASIAMAPVVYWVVDSFARLVELPELARSVAPITSALLVSAGALAITVTRPSTIPRWAREVGIAVVGVPAIVAAVLAGRDSTWLSLLIGAVTVLLVATSADGLFSSTSWRRQLGWVALALAAGGLWWRLADGRVTALEPYVLPIAGLLLIVAVLIWRAARRRVPPSPSGAAPLVALGGLLVAILPLAAASINGEVLRPIVVGAVSVALLLLGTLVVGGPGIRPYLDAAALAGAIGTIVTAFGRAIVLSLDRADSGDLALDGWLAAAFIALVVAAFGLCRARADAAQRLRLVAARVLGILAMVGVLVIEAPLFAVAPLGSQRAFIVIMLFSAILVIAFLVNQAPLTASIGWTAAGSAAAAALVGISVGALRPIELGTVPLALALLAAGAVHLERTPTARSWPFLAPGLLVLLLPSLLATIVDRPIWRLVALGVVAITVLVIGLALRLQAPFVIGVVVVLIHAIATFSEQIRIAYEAVPWWLWLGIGGALVTVLAATYEKRIGNLKSVALRLASLR
jgi:hypothetical protein